VTGETDEDSRLLAAVAVASGCSAGLAAPAHADPGTDQQFVNALKEQGVPVASDGDAVALGHSTCEQLQRGDAPLDVLQHVESVTKWSQDASIGFINLSARAYCPDMTAKLQEAAAAPAPTAPGGEQVDEGVLDALQKRRVPIVSDTAAIELAHSTCAVLGRGGSADDALYHVAQNDAVRHYPNNKDQEVRNLQAFTSIAVGVYCPQRSQ
jgi:Protein of unknown function (DUF732)